MKNHQQLTLPGGGRYGFDDIVGADESTLEKLVLGGTLPDMTSVAGWDFRGHNISAASKLLNLRRFIKGFFPLPTDAPPPEIIDGYNLWVWQDRGLEKPWRQITKNGKPWRHGFYKAHPVESDSLDNKYPNALLIDYALAENPFYHPGTLLKDYFTQVYDDNPDLYIGKVYVGLGDLRVFGGYFVFERESPSEPD